METKPNMNPRPIPTPKKNDNGLVGGALGAAIGTAFGAVFGVGSAYAYNRLTDNEEDIPEITIEPNTDEEVSIAPEPQPTHTVHHHHHHTDVVVVPTPVNNNNGGGGGGEVIGGGGGGGEVTGGGGDDIRVLSYERITMDDGSQMDVATVSMNGQQAAIVDVDLDGWADGMMADYNSDGNISEDEIQSFQGTDVQISMGDLAAVAEQNNVSNDPGNGPSSEVVVYEEGFEGDDTGESGESGEGGDVIIGEGETDTDIYPEDDPNLLMTSNEGTDGTLPDYCNTGDVSDVVGDSDDMLLV